METTNHQNSPASEVFRRLLQDTFVERCKQNPSYSLRAYSRSLGVAPSPLSAIMRGVRPLSEKMTLRLVSALGLSISDLTSLYSSVSFVPAKFGSINLNTYAIVSDWYHYGILELMRVKNFKTDIRWISKQLSITPTEVSIAVKRLKESGLLKIHEDGSWEETGASFKTNIHGRQSGDASKKLQKQVLEKALKALEELPNTVRDNTSMTMAIDSSLIPEAIESIKKFRRELTARLEKKSQELGGANHVYNLGIAFYPLTQISEGDLSHENN